MVSALFPYKPDDGHRDLVFGWILERYALVHPDVEICVGEAEPFSRSKARNDAFRKATGDIIIVNDADTFCSAVALEAAITIAAGGQWVLPYHHYYNLTESYSTKILDSQCEIDLVERELEFDFLVDQARHPPDGSVAGVLVMPRFAFEAVGGYDERFEVWGYEDDAMAFVLDRVWAPHRRLFGLCLHLWHPPAPDGDFKHPDTANNRQLFEEIKRGNYLSVAR